MSWYCEVTCDVAGNTYNSILTIQVVSAGVAISACLKAGELLLGSLTGVHLDFFVPVRSAPGAPASSNHDQWQPSTVIKLNGTSIAENGKNKISIHSD